MYSALGSRVTVVEFMDQLMPGSDADLVKPLADRLKKRGVAIHLGTQGREGRSAARTASHASFEGDKPPDDHALRPRAGLGRPHAQRRQASMPQTAGVAVTERGFISVDPQMRTNVPHIFAIGDLVGQPMLAHKATHEGKLAAEVAAGEKREWVARVIPSVAYTDPEIAWVGVTETEAKAERHRCRRRQVPVGGLRPRGRHGPHRRLHQAAVRRGHASRHRRRHRRRARGRPDRRDRAWPSRWAARPATSATPSIRIRP